MDKAIIIENLTKRYRNQRGVTDIRLEVEQGEIFGFLGPNGSGKTTVMKIMVGLMKPDRGEVKLNGHSVLKNYEQAMSRVGCMIETVSLYPYLSAWDCLQLTANFSPDTTKERMEECLHLTGLFKFKDEKTKNFSLGMKQRLGIALAILNRPTILVLDEPFNGLDVEGMVDLRNLVLKLAKEEGTTFFISSHLIHDVERTCTKIGILYNGKLLSVDSSDHILKNYSSLENYYLSEVD